MVTPRSDASLPAVPDTFTWTDRPWGASLACVPMLPLAPHLFSTRQLALASPVDLQTLAESVDARAVAMVTQVHGQAAVVVRTGMAPPDPRPEADVLLSDSPDVAVAVRAADCVPLLIADSRRGVVAAVHAGWRGTATGAATAAVEGLQREFGSSPGDLVACIGPSIGPCCYEVGPELVDAFAAAGHARHLIDRWFLAPPPRRGERARPRMHLDVPGANRDQLILAGVPEAQIYLCGLCTAMHLDVLTSYRAEQERAGRLVGVIRGRRSEV